MNSPKIFENFAEFQLLNNNNSQIFIHDIIGFVHQNDESENDEENELDYEDKKSLIWEEKENNNNIELNNSFNINETYFCFILDNLNGVYMNIYDINNSNEYIETDDKEEKDIKNYTYYDQIFNLYKNYYKDLPYISANEENNIYSNKKDVESEKGFGYVKINEKDKKMFEIAPKRYIVEEVIKAYERNDKNPQLNLDFLSGKTKEKIREENARKLSVNSVDSDLSANAIPNISNEEYEAIKNIIDKFNIGKTENNKMDEEDK